ncbi:MAG TPA: imidazole glycerol phosphate synthase subunit HisH [Caulobacteraceae bacterium]|nr:imidazole glycerol phosphate synthase subunit HisH [Caulobacteraceae bacterium]
MQSVALINYGSGNLRSAEKALQKAAAGLERPAAIVTTGDPDVIARADRVVLPGVGAFAACMNAVRERDGVVEAMTEAVRRKGAPFLGVCVGMQLLAERGLEFGVTEGLGWIGGEVRRLEPHGGTFKIPHMGWNALDGALPGALFAGLGSGTHMYFTHSFAVFPADEADVAATTDHGGRFCAAVLKDNVAGVQFHPEKSQAAGGRLLANFLEWRP